MTNRQVDLLNIALMIGSLIAALFPPFEIFLLSYAILGPLHYLTEISWLHDHNYFMPDKWLAVPIVLLTTLTLVTSGFFPIFASEELRTWGTETLFGTLVVALVFVTSKSTRARIIGSLFVVAACITAHAINAQVHGMQPSDSQTMTGYEIFFVVFLMTIIHVFVFTAAFVLYGALRAQSRTGYLSFLVLLQAPARASSFRSVCHPRSRTTPRPPTRIRRSSYCTP